MAKGSSLQTKRISTALLILTIILLAACGGNSSDSAADNATLDNSDETALPVALNNAGFQSTHFSGSANCAECHNGLTNAVGSDVSIEADWSTSMMANSARDPFWRAKVASEIERNPRHRELLDRKCSRCHTPMANVEAKFEGSTVELFGDGFLNPKNVYYDHAIDGVSCTVCHQIEDDGKLGTPNGFSGQYSIVDLGTSAERTAFGQYANPLVSPMLMNTNFRPSHATHVSDSAICATCHNLKTPFVDSSGAVVSTTAESEFPEQMVYTEWENSSFASGTLVQSCQDCHMPKTDGVMISVRPHSLASRDDFARHSLIGANTTMLDILSRNKAALGITATGFASAIERSRAMLISAADIEIVNQSLTGNELVVQLRIHNRSGHKVPTSFPSRRIYLHFVVRDDAGNILFESGRTNADGSVVGVDADTDLSRFEPHYDEITRQNQVQVYESIMNNTDSEVTYTLLRAAAYVKDNRIPPPGFDKNRVGNDVRVAGAAMADDNFNSGSDLVTYRIDVGTARPVSFRAELKYQALAYGFVRDLFRDNSNPEVAKFESLYDGASIRAETIHSVQATQF